MKNIDCLKEYVNNNDVVLVRNTTKNKIHRQYIKMLCDSNYLEKKARGVYVKKDEFVNDFFLLQCKYKAGIFSHNTALYLYYLTDRTPLKYDMTFKSNVRVKNSMVKSHYLKEDKYLIGITKYKCSDGTIIKVYDMERTIIDVIRDRNKIDLQVFNTAIKEYMKRGDKNLSRLIKYAKMFKVDKVLQKYMEVL